MRTVRLLCLLYLQSRMPRLLRDRIAGIPNRVRTYQGAVFTPWVPDIPTLTTNSNTQVFLKCTFNDHNLHTVGNKADCGCLRHFLPPPNKLGLLHLVWNTFTRFTGRAFFGKVFQWTWCWSGGGGGIGLPLWRGNFAGFTSLTCRIRLRCQVYC